CAKEGEVYIQRTMEKCAPFLKDSALPQHTIEDFGTYLAEQSTFIACATGRHYLEGHPPRAVASPAGQYSFSWWDDIARRAARTVGGRAPWNGTTGVSPAMPCSPGHEYKA
ncbi:unnamed protein product, partial [marine sediment metagenome]